MFALVHRSRPATATTRSHPDVCPDCGHPAVRLPRSAVGRLAHKVHPSRECHHAMYEYSVLRDESCGCRSRAHLG